MTPKCKVNKWENGRKGVKICFDKFLTQDIDLVERGIHFLFHVGRMSIIRWVQTAVSKLCENGVSLGYNINLPWTYFIGHLPITEIRICQTLVFDWTVGYKGWASISSISSGSPSKKPKQRKIYNGNVRLMILQNGMKTMCEMRMHKVSLC